jgi:hypothetical protein
MLDSFFPRLLLVPVAYRRAAVAGARYFPRMIVITVPLMIAGNFRCGPVLHSDRHKRIEVSVMQVCPTDSSDKGSLTCDKPGQKSSALARHQLFSDTAALFRDFF